MQGSCSLGSRNSGASGVGVLGRRAFCAWFLGLEFNTLCTLSLWHRAGFRSSTEMRVWGSNGRANPTLPKLSSTVEFKAF